MGVANKNTQVLGNHVVKASKKAIVNWSVTCRTPVYCIKVRCATNPYILPRHTKTDTAFRTKALDFRTAADDYLPCRLICQLFSQLIS